MTSSGVKLVLDEEVRQKLAALLTAALEMPEGARVVDHVSRTPWGDVEDFRRAVYLPLHGAASARERGADATEVIVEPHEVAPMKDVLEGLAESISGGVPWTGLTAPEREATTRIASRLPGAR
jgi:hypothetical protein